MEIKLEAPVKAQDIINMCTYNRIYTKNGGYQDLNTNPFIIEYKLACNNSNDKEVYDLIFDKYKKYNYENDPSFVSTKLFDEFIQMDVILEFCNFREGVYYIGYKVYNASDKILKILNAQYEKVFSSKVSKWGNSLAIRLPKEILKDLSLSDGDEVEFFKKDGQLYIKKKRVIRKYRLEDCINIFKHDVEIMEQE
jgi:Growth regulator